jgi:phosphoribosylformylglycinamidine synthase
VARRVLLLPTVADKSFLITIGDRSVGAMTVRDQMVGPWQVPVADCAVTTLSFEGYKGEAMAMGERTPLAVIDAAASGRMAVGEAITNIAAAPIADISDIKLSANWMAACGQPGQDAALFDTVKAVGMELCPALGISIPVGKDSLSMRTTWNEDGENKAVVSPVSLIVSGFAPVTDVRRTLTPQLRTDLGDTALILVDLGRGKNRMGASSLAQVTQQLGDDTPDVDSPQDLKAFFAAIQQLNNEGKLLAYHDRSDGGLYATLVEMAFAGRAGVTVNLDILTMEGEHAADQGDAKNWAGQVAERRNEMTLRALFSEELGAVIQVRSEREDGRDERAAFLRPGRLQPHHRQDQRARRDRVHARRQSHLQRAPQRTAPPVERDQLAHRAPARQPGLRRPGIRSPAGRNRSRASRRSWCTTPP